MTKPKRIFTVGHMGTGKFIFTEALAKKLEWQLIDANPSRGCMRTTTKVPSMVNN